MKTIELYVVAFIALFFGTSFSNYIAAQSGDELMEQLYMLRGEDKLREVGVLSLNIRLDGSVFVYDLLLDENVESVHSLGKTMSFAKKKSETGDFLTSGDSEMIELLETKNYSF